MAEDGFFTRSWNRISGAAETVYDGAASLAGKAYDGAASLTGKAYDGTTGLVVAVDRKLFGDEVADRTAAAAAALKQGNVGEFVGHSGKRFSGMGEVIYDKTTGVGIEVDRTLFGDEVADRTAEAAAALKRGDVKEFIDHSGKRFAGMGEVVYDGTAKVVTEVDRKLFGDEVAAQTAAAAEALKNGNVKEFAEHSAKSWTGAGELTYDGVAKVVIDADRELFGNEVAVKTAAAAEALKQGDMKEYLQHSGDSWKKAVEVVAGGEEATPTEGKAATPATPQQQLKQNQK